MPAPPLAFCAIKYDGYVAHEFSPKNGIESRHKADLFCDV